MKNIITFLLLTHVLSEVAKCQDRSFKKIAISDYVYSIRSKHILLNDSVKCMAVLSLWDNFLSAEDREDFATANWSQKEVQFFSQPDYTYRYIDGSLFANDILLYEPLVLTLRNIDPACQVPRPADPLRQYAVKSIGKNLYAIDLTDFNNRVLVLQTSESLVVFEAPISYEVGKTIVHVLRKQFPGKPVSHVFVTHHHPDHAGAIRAFTNEGAIVLTSSGNRAFFEKMLGFPHLLAASGEPLRKPTKALRFELIDQQRVFTIGDESFSVYFTDKTQHTDEYLMAYFPSEKILFQGDLCFFEPGEESPASVREMAVYELIKEHKLAVDKIYSSWPIHGYKEFGTWSDLMRKVALAEKSK